MTDDGSLMQESSQALVDGVRAAVGPWVMRSVEEVMVAAGFDFGQVAVATAEVAADAAVAVADRVSSLLAAEVAAQSSTPLAILREAVDYPAGVLAAAGVPPVPREAVRSRLFPDDVYDLAPASFAEVDATLGPLGLAWGVAKAAAVRSRRRTRVVAYVPDLMDRSKVAAANAEVVFVKSPSELAGATADLVVVDLTRPGVVEAIGPVAESTRVVGFANHTQRPLMDQARAAGCEAVMPRSEFFSHLAEILGPASS